MLSQKIGQSHAAKEAAVRGKTYCGQKKDRLIANLGLERVKRGFSLVAQRVLWEFSMGYIIISSLFCYLKFLPQL